jgi:hypothetical protein
MAPLKQTRLDMMFRPKARPVAPPVDNDDDVIMDTIALAPPSMPALAEDKPPSDKNQTSRPDRQATKEAPEKPVIKFDHDDENDGDDEALKPVIQKIRSLMVAVEGKQNSYKIEILYLIPSQHISCIHIPSFSPAHVFPSSLFLCLCLHRLFSLFNYDCSIYAL